MMIDMVVTHLCMECDEYYEAYQMADIEAHVCNGCASRIDHENESALLRSTIKGLEADNERLVARIEELERELAEAHESLQRFGDEAAQDDGSGLSDEPGYLGSVTWKGWKVDLYDDDEEAADNG